MVTATGRGAHVARRQLSRRRPGQLEPQDRRRFAPTAMSSSSIRRATSWSATRVDADRQPARRDDRQSARRAGKRRAHRRDARRHARGNGVTTLENAVYSPCPVTTPDGCPQAIRAGRSPPRAWSSDPATQPHPLRRRAARAVRHHPAAAADLQRRHRRRRAAAYRGCAGARHQLLELATGSSSRLPYYWRFAPESRPHADAACLHRDALPALEGTLPRPQPASAPIQIGGFVTYGEIDDPDLDAIDARRAARTSAAISRPMASSSSTRYWSITGSLRAATDKTVTRRYDITRDDRLRNFINVERIDRNSYISIAGWAFQGLRVDDVQKQIPIALPAIDARFRLDRAGRSAARSSCRPTASRSCASTARTRSAPSPARAGTCAG